MKPAWRWLAGGLLTYLVFLVLTAPAATVVAWLAGENPAFRLVGVQGSLWSGRAAALDVRMVRLTDIRWRFRPFALVTGRLELALDARFGEQPLEATAGRALFGAAYLNDVRGRVAASELVSLMRLGQAEVGGELDVDLERVVMPAGGWPAFEGVVVWEPARVVAPVAVALGQARLQTAIVDGDTSGQLTATGGDVQINADVALRQSGAYRIDAVVRQSGSMPPAVGDFLSTFAEYRNGEYRLEWADSL